MEESAMDALYGDFGQGCDDSTLNHDEDSVDIYSGLEGSPIGDGSNCENRTILSPQRLKESMDLYEELLTQEQEKKDSTYNELKSKFDAAQIQVKELIGKLQQMQTKNSSLHKENTLLKKNICALIKTARMEIVRKDEEISKLSNRPGRVRLHTPRVERSHGSYLKSQTIGNIRESQDCTRGVTESSENKNRSRLSSQLHHLITQTETSVSSCTVPQRLTRSDLDSPQYRQSKDADGMTQDRQRIQSESTSKGKENAHSESEITKSQSGLDARQKVNETEKQLRNKEGGKECLVSNKQNTEQNSKEKDMSEKSQCDVDKSDRRTSATSYNSQRQQTEDPVVLRRSGRSKSPFSQPEHVSSSKLSCQTSRGLSRSTEDTQSHSRKHDLRHSQGEDKHSRTEISWSEKPGTSLDRKMEKRGSREQHRKEERRQENEKRHTRTDGSKEYEQKKTQESEERKRWQGSSRGEKRNTRSETSKEGERRSAKESEGSLSREEANKVDKHVKDGREGNNRRNPSPAKGGGFDGGRTRRKDCDEDINKRKTSSKTDEPLSRSKASSNHNDSRGGKSSHVSHSASDRHIVKEKRANEDKAKQRSDKEKQSNALDKTTVLAADSKKATSTEKSRNGENAGETVQAHPLANKHTQSPQKSTSSRDISAVPEENSPNRKLTFMETLNLTLSPIKKQSQPNGVEEPIKHPSEDAVVDSLVEEGGLFQLGDEFCVVDETQNNEEPVEAMFDDSAAPVGTVAQSNQGQVASPGSERPKAGLKEVKEREKVGKEMIKGCASTFENILMETETQKGDEDHPSNSSTSTSEKCTESSPCASAEVCLPAEASEPVNRLSFLLVEDVCMEQNPQVPAKECDDRNKENCCKESHIENHPELQIPPFTEGGSSLEEVSTSVEVHAIPDAFSDFNSASLEVVSSTVSVEMNSLSKHGCADPQTIVPEMKSNSGLKKLDSGSRPPEKTHFASSNTSDTVREKGTLPEQTTSSEPDSTEDDLQSSKLSSSKVVHQDEDSMMLTLSSIKVIPEAISPLTSPVRQTRKVQLHCSGREQHIKSLNKEFSSLAIVTSKDTTKMDMNKENQRPDIPVIPSVGKDQEVLSSTATEEELEEGEIVSKSDDESCLNIQSPPYEKSKSASKSHPSPSSRRVEKRTRPAVTPTREQCKKTTGAAKDSPKRRFKTITVPPKANISTSAEFMNMMVFIRSELRRKYMKLHKNVTKSAFCCIVDMSLASFTEFVDGVNFQKFCCQGNDIKPRLNKIISTIMNKISSNGIVNRIFEQRADDLKQKLWNFVDGQFDFLFKELKAVLRSLPELTTEKHSSPVPKEDSTAESFNGQTKKPLSTVKPRPNKNDKQEGQEREQRNTPLLILPKLRGLGSRGKNIKATIEDGAQTSEMQSLNQPPAVPSPEKTFQENTCASENKTPTYARRLSHSGLPQDKTDFEILTEQQTSSLTFNLATDSQMGDIFRCLLQGTDLLEASASAGDNPSWPLNTPRKEAPAGESLSGIVTPNKIITPSKFITAWTSISPYKFTSSNNKIQMPLNPAVFDESCLLEVPSNTIVNQVASGLTTVVSSHQPFSILAEDLAVSLTIPSPLKSDGHLSFLHPASGQPLSAPSSVISAHYSEDALIDGEDVTEQDIHLALDSDNSSRGSSTRETWEGSDPAVFQFKPNIPMQAEVMERSNDHFIVRIRHTSTGAPEETRKELEAAMSAVDADVVCGEDRTSSSHVSSDSGSPMTTQPLVSSDKSTAQLTSKDNSSGLIKQTPATLQTTTVNPAEKASSDLADCTHTPDATNHTCERMSRKRRKHQSGSKAKRSRAEKHQDRREAKEHRHKKRSKSCKERGEKTPSKKESRSPEVSPSLSAKNVVKKKGEVVVTWTRDEDRDILVELKMKGASLKTFTVLSAKLKKSPAQIEERFTQLMKLFKKKEKMET